MLRSSDFQQRVTETERHAQTLSRKLYLMKFLTLAKFWARGGGFPAIFFVSGLSGLIYESIWTHYLKLFLGHAAYAQTLVLIIFMGGLAIGAAQVGKLTLAISHPVRVYALVEGTIGVFGLIFHQLYLGSTEAFWSITPNLASFPWLLQISRWALATALILPQAVLLGATFPLLAAGVMRRSPGDSGGVIATLYFSNSLGGALGVLLSGFVLVPFCGMPNTVAIAGLLNLVVASVAWSLQRDEPEPLLTAAFARTTAQSSESLSIRFVVMVAFATGASSFVYEVGWIRMLSLVMGECHLFI